MTKGFHKYLVWAILYANCISPFLETLCLNHSSLTLYDKASFFPWYSGLATTYLLCSYCSGTSLPTSPPTSGFGNVWKTGHILVPLTFWCMANVFISEYFRVDLHWDYLPGIGVPFKLESINSYQTVCMKHDSKFYFLKGYPIFMNIDKTWIQLLIVNKIIDNILFLKSNKI